jgi:hypothetical protein
MAMVLEGRPRRWNLLRLFSICCGLATLGLAPSCSKVNDIDMKSGNLPVGAACDVAADSCAGSCIGGTCRAPCGPNRECPSNEQCVGDGEAAGCVPADFGKLNLLKDCASGCSATLASFGREGYFYRCEVPEDFQYYEVPAAKLAFGRPSNFDPATVCSRVTERAFAIKGDLTFTLDDSCDQAHVGVTNGQLVRHGCLSYMDQAPTTVADVGYLYDTGGDTYLLSAPYGDTAVFKFQAGAVTESPKSCGPFASDYGYATADQQKTCTKPTYPAIGNVPAGYTGFWAECPYTEGGASQNVVYDLPGCAAAKWGDGKWTYEMDRGNAYPNFNFVTVNAEGSMVDGRWFYRGQGCTGALRELGSSGLVATINRSATTIEVEAEAWEVFSEGAATLLRTRDNNNRISVFRKLERPPEYATDPCENAVPQLGF